MVNGGDSMLMGEFHHNLDVKNRIILPVKFRNEIGNKVVITRGLDHCLFLYSYETFNEILNKLSSLSFTKEDSRVFMRIFLSGATIQEFDKQGRIMITKELISYASLKQNCVIIGVGDRIEIWDLDSWNSFYDEKINQFEQISNNVLNSYSGD